MCINYKRNKSLYISQDKCDEIMCNNFRIDHEFLKGEFYILATSTFTDQILLSKLNMARSRTYKPGQIFIDRREPEF